MSTADDIRARLAVLQPESLELEDESERHRGHAGYRPGGGTHWRLSIVARAFAGQSTVARHRLVYQALGGLMQDPIHALAIHARAPGEPGAGA
ncbi:MAG TPA: BolA family protein [Burkholderiales bacterium]|nr:BolA family protein [Burkholderiales bacterium]